MSSGPDRQDLSENWRAREGSCLGWDFERSLLILDRIKSALGPSQKSNWSVEKLLSLGPQVAESFLLCELLRSA